MGYNIVQTTSPKKVVFSFNNRNARPFLLSLLRILYADPRLLAGGLVVAPFSNGGAILLPALSDFLALPLADGDAPPSTPSSLHRCGVHITSEDAAAVAAVRGAIAGIVLDSCPCYMHAAVGADALVEGMGLRRRPLAAALVRACFLLLCVVNVVIFGNPAVRFWDALSDAQYAGVPELYMYSTKDKLLDPEQLDALVDHRSKAHGCDVCAWRVDDAAHIQMRRRYREEYYRRLEKVNESGVNVWRERQGLSRWEPPAVEVRQLR